MELKYFYYISKPKVDMLLAQLHRTRFGFLSFTPRIEFAGLSVAGDLKTERNKDLVVDTSRLLKALRKRGAISRVSVDHEMDGQNFYHSEDLWRHGVGSVIK